MPAGLSTHKPVELASLPAAAAYEAQPVPGSLEPAVPTLHMPHARAACPRNPPTRLPPPACRCHPAWVQGMSGPLNVARMRLTMEGAGNSSACLAARTCLPLGGHSVAGALPPLRNATGPGGNMPLILVLAAMDTTAFFHEKAQVRAYSAWGGVWGYIQLGAGRH